MNYDQDYRSSAQMYELVKNKIAMASYDQEAPIETTQPEPQPLSFGAMLDRIEQVITADPEMMAIFTARFAATFADVKAKPNLNDFPLDFQTLEVSIWDNQPLGRWKKVKETDRAPVRFNATVKASLGSNRKPLDRPDWIANVCELRSPDAFGKMVRQRWKLTGAEREIADQLALMEGVLIGRMKIALKGRGQGGEHFYPNHFIVVREEDVLAKNLAGAVVLTPGGKVRVGSFSPTRAGGELFPINERPNGNKSAVILQSRHSTRASLSDWSSGVSSIVE